MRSRRFISIDGPSALRLILIEVTRLVKSKYCPDRTEWSAENVLLAAGNLFEDKYKDISTPFTKIFHCGDEF